MEFRKKTLIVFLTTIFLVSAAAIAVPVNAVDQTVTGETLSAYIVTMPVAFGQMAPSSSQELTAVITASDYAAVIGVDVADTTVDYAIDVLDSLEYDIGGTVECTITAPTTGGLGQSYVITGTNPFSVAALAFVDLTAYTGTDAGFWDDVVITLTITPT